MGNTQGLESSGKSSGNATKEDSPMPLRDELEEQFAQLVAHMNLPEDKKQAVMDSSIEKKWQMIKDMDKRSPQLPPKEFLNKIKSMMEEESMKKAKKKSTDSVFVQNLQALEISLRTNHISWVKEFLNLENQGLHILVQFLQFRFKVDKELSTKKDDKGRNLKSPKSPVQSKQSTESFLLSKNPVSSQDSDIHIAVLCLKALMNNAHGFTAVMDDSNAISCLVNSMFYGTLKTVITIMELLAAVCLVKGGHVKIMESVDVFKIEHKESRRFERLVKIFKESKGNHPEFQAACMAFINVIVHSAENLNFRVHLQHEFTMLGLDEYLEEIEEASPAALLAQMQAYKDNYFNVQLLIEESAIKSEAVIKLEQQKYEMEEIQDKYHRSEYQSIKRIAELEKKLAEIQNFLKNGGKSPPGWLSLESEEVWSPKVTAINEGKVPPDSFGDTAEKQKDINIPLENPPIYDALTPAPPPPAPPIFIPVAPNAPPLPGIGFTRPIKRKIDTKYKLPLLNWVAIPPIKIGETVFNELDDENIFKLVDFTEFEESFKLKSQADSNAKENALNATSAEIKRKNVEGVLEPNRAQNIAIAQRKFDFNRELISKAISKMDLQLLPLESVEIINHLVPNETEIKKIRNFLDSRKNPEILPDEDRFIFELYMIERLVPKLQVMEFMGNFNDDLQILSQQIDAVIAASNSVLSAVKLKKVIEVILAIGNYMNSSKRGGVFGFRLQSLDILNQLKSTDGKITLLRFTVSLIRNNFSDIKDFTDELTYLDKASSVSLELLVQDVKQIQKGFENAKNELIHDKNNTKVKEFIFDAEPKAKKLEQDLKTAQEAYGKVVKFYGENPKHTQPSNFFGVFLRFVRAYQQANLSIEAEIKLQTLQAPLTEEVMMKEEDDTVQVLNQIHDGAIDEIITGMKSNAFRPAEMRGYRRSKVFRKSFVARDSDKSTADTGPNSQEKSCVDSYSASRPWLK